MVKRKAEGDLPDTISLQPVIEPSSPGRSPPFAVYFASGYQPGDKDRTQWEPGQGKHADVDFVGASPSPDALGPPTCKYAVGMLDKREGVMRYAEIGGIVRMEPRVRGFPYGPSGATTVQETDVAARHAQNQRLVAAFGSTRRKRQLDAKETAKVEGGNVTAMEAVEDLLAKAGDKAAAAGMTKVVAQMRNIPPHHPDATTAPEAYRLEELVPEQAWEALEVGRLRRAIQDDAYREDLLRAKGIFPDAVLKRLPALRPDAPTGARRLRALAYLGPLVHLYTGRHELRADSALGGDGGMAALSGRTKVPEAVLEGCLERFYTRDESAQEGALVFRRSKEQARMLLLHLLLAALIAEDYQLGAPHFEALRAELKLPPQDLVTCYREMGCVVTGASRSVAESPLKQYKVELLPGNNTSTGPPKTLAECFPKLASPGRARQR